MNSLYEKLMGRMSSELKPIASGNDSPIKRVKRKVWSFHPFITVSREPGSGGKPIAKKLAKLTRFKFYDKALMEEVAKSARKREDLIKSIDERDRTTIQDIVHSLFNPDYVSDVKYIRQLCNVILTLTEKGSVIILGRGANLFTSHETGLHVRVSAPYLVRVERAVKYEKVSESKAKKIIQKVDAHRKKFIRQYFGKNVSNANYYDLVINTSYMGIDDAANLILKAFEHKFPGYLKHFKLFHQGQKE